MDVLIGFMVAVWGAMALMLVHPLLALLWLAGVMLKTIDVSTRA